MTLTLEISSSPGGKSGDTRHVFTEEGGTIGRAPSNSWVLPYKEVSGQHAVISHHGGVFYIKDLKSTNGVSVNSPANRLAPHQPYALKNGDRLFIDPYEIDVYIDAGVSPQSRRPFPDPLASDDPFAPFPPGQPLAQVSGPGVDPMGLDEVDPLKFFDALPKLASPRKPDVNSRPVDDLLSEPYRPPLPLPGPALDHAEPGAIPADYDPLAPDDPFLPSAPPIRPRPSDSVRARPKDLTPSVPVAPPVRPPAPPVRPPAPPVQVQPPPVPPPAPAPVPAAVPPPPPVQAGSVAGSTPAGSEFATLLTGAGLEGAAVTPELAQNLGEILRVVVDGLIDVLRARQSIKEEFGIRQTTVRAAGNNPLKFSVNLEDALHNLLVKRNPAYLGPVEAFAEAFDDLRHHQLAMLAGIRVAFDAMLATFDPDKLEEEFGRAVKGSVGLKTAQHRYWDLFRERRRDMVRDPDAAFTRLFGEEFARAYEEQFRRLKSERRGGSGDRSSGNTRPPRK